MKEIQDQAEALIKEHCPGWKFRWSRAKRQFGCCHYKTRVISLSYELARRNPQEVENVILHEIAHALVGRYAHHGPIWKKKAIEIGCDGERCYNAGELDSPKGRMVYRCIHCGEEVRQHRRSRKQAAHLQCCKEHNRGKFDRKYLLVLDRIE